MSNPNPKTVAALLGQPPPAKAKAPIHVGPDNRTVRAVRAGDGWAPPKAGWRIATSSEVAAIEAAEARAPEVAKAEAEEAKRREGEASGDTVRALAKAVADEVAKLKTKRD